MLITTWAILKLIAKPLPPKERLSVKRTRPRVQLPPHSERASDLVLEAVPRVTRAAVLEMDPVKDLVPNLDLAKALALNPDRMMDTLEVVTDLATVLGTGLERDLVRRDTLVPRDLALDPRAAVTVPNLHLMTVVMEVATGEEMATMTMILH